MEGAEWLSTEIIMYKAVLLFGAPLVMQALGAGNDVNVLSVAIWASTNLILGRALIGSRDRAKARRLAWTSQSHFEKQEPVHA